MEVVQGGESGSRWNEEGIREELGLHRVSQAGRDFAWSRERSSLPSLLELGKDKKEILPGLEQRWKPNTGFGNPNEVRTMFVQEVMQQPLRVGNQPKWVR